MQLLVSSSGSRVPNEKRALNVMRDHENVLKNRAPHLNVRGRINNSLAIHRHIYATHLVYALSASPIHKIITPWQTHAHRL